MQPTAEAEADWVDTIVKLSVMRERFLEECTPGYYNNEGGELDLRTAKNNQYWRGPVTFVKLLERWREDGAMPGLELTLSPSRDAQGSVPEGSPGTPGLAS